MAQHDYIISNDTGAAVRADINNMATAVVSKNSGPIEPSTTYPGMWWRDTSASPSILKQRNNDNDAWINVFDINESADGIKLSNNVKTLSFYGGDLATAVADNPTNGVTIIVDVTPNPLTAHLIVTSNITLDWKRYCVISGGFTLTINGELIAGVYQLFDTNINIVGLKDTYPEWWDIDGTNDEIQINKAIQSATNKTILDNDYTISSDVVAKSNVDIIGKGSIQHTETTGNIINVNGQSNIKIVGLTLAAQDDVVADAYGIYVHNGSDNILVSDNNISHIGQMGVVIDSSTNCTVRDNEVSEIGQYAIWLYSPSGFITRSTVENNYIHDVGAIRVIGGTTTFGRGVMLEHVSGNTVKNNRLHHIEEYGIRLWSTSGECSNNAISENLIDGDGVTRKGIFLYDVLCYRNLIDGNKIYDLRTTSGDEGISVTGKDNLITKNIIKDAYTGINCSTESSNEANIVAKNNISALNAGINASLYSIVSKNIVKVPDNKFGILTAGFNSVIVDSNIVIIDGTLGTGIFIQSGSNFTVVNSNIVVGGARGVDVTGGSITTTITGNVLQNQSEVSIYDFAGDSYKFNNYESMNDTGQARGRKSTYYYITPDRGTWQKGDFARNSVAGVGISEGWVCVTSGTFGSSTAGTGSISTGSRTLEVTSVGNLLPGFFIDIAGVTGTKKIVDIDGTTITVDSDSDATVSGASISLPDPTFSTLANLS